MVTDPVRRLEERIENCDDGREIMAAHMLAIEYDIGQNVPQDSQRAHQLWVRAAAMGSRDAHYNLSQSYGKFHKERGVEKDDKKELYHLEEAAMLGDAASRCELGIYEGDRGNWDQAKRHWMLSASAGCEGCLYTIKRGLQKGVVSEGEYKKTLRDYEESIKLTKSLQRVVGKHILGKHIKFGPGGVNTL
mmetsp:Transcript_24119/g.34495  ORF Transcript_24119/g.34495 Transcript_24119/m.34495 type:complete len:190 (+) Transcript_24119:778-1347(+)